MFAGKVRLECPGGIDTIKIETTNQETSGGIESTCTKQNGFKTMVLR